MEIEVLSTVLMLFLMISPLCAAESRPIIPPAGVQQGRITEAQVIAAAKKFAQEKGVSLLEYQEPSARYDEEDGEWWVNFTENPPVRPGGHFSITVDAATGKPLQLYHGQ